MRIAIFDGTAVQGAGTTAPGRAAQFSSPTVTYAREQGHTVTVHNGFSPEAARDADLVWTEWCNETAFAAAASGVCNNLVIRMRGYDVWLPLERLEWTNVSKLVYESPILEDLALRRFPFLQEVSTAVISSGLELPRWSFKMREPNRTFAILARADYRKGHNLAIEWARQHPDYQIHTTLALPQSNPRLVEYLRAASPDNFHVHLDVPNIPKWIDEIGATYLLSTAFWEDFGYSIAEGMAMGLKPLIYGFPNADRVWDSSYIWNTLSELDKLVEGEFDSLSYRQFVEQNLDGAKQAKRFFDFLGPVASRAPEKRLSKRRVSFSDFITVVEQRLSTDPAQAEKAVMDFYKADVPGSAEVRAYASMILAGFYLQSDPVEAQTWAFQALSDGPRADAFCVLGELEWQQNRLDAAMVWYDAACDVSMPDAYSPLRRLVDNMIVRRRNMRRISCGPETTLLRRFTDWIDTGFPFTFVKFGDGELQCMGGFEGANSDGQAYGDELGEKLKEAFLGLAPMEWVHIAEWIGPYRDVRDALVEKLEHLPSYAPYHMLLLGVDNLRPELLDFYKAIVNSDRPKVFVGPQWLSPVTEMLKATHVVVPETNSYGNLDVWMKAIWEVAEDNAIFVFSAGMPAKIAIHEILKAFPNITCIDAGSAFDPLFNDGRTRSGQPDPAVARLFFRELLP